MQERENTSFCGPRRMLERENTRLCRSGRLWTDENARKHTVDRDLDVHGFSSPGNRVRGTGNLTHRGQVVVSIYDI